MSLDMYRLGSELEVLLVERKAALNPITSRVAAANRDGKTTIVRPGPHCGCLVANVGRLRVIEEVVALDQLARARALAPTLVQAQHGKQAR